MIKFRDCKLLSIVLVVSTQLVNFTTLHAIRSTPAVPLQLAHEVTITLSPAAWAFFNTPQCQGQGAVIKYLNNNFDNNGDSDPSMSCTYNGTTTFYNPPAATQSPNQSQFPIWLGGYNTASSF